VVITFSNDGLLIVSADIPRFSN